MTKNVIMTDVYDKNGNLTRVDFYSVPEMKFEFEAVWDENDDQSHENRQRFRIWAAEMAKKLEFNVLT
jgi:hypothetical protein